MSNRLKIWIIDDEGHFRETLKQCFNIQRGESGDFQDNTFVRIVNGDKKGKYALEAIKREIHNPQNIPDIIFCDLRLDKIEESNITDNLKLSGVKLLEDIANIPEYKSTQLFVFSQVNLSQADRNNIQKRLSYFERSTRFFDKTKLKLDNTSLDEIEDVKIDKTCETLHAIVTFLSERY